MYCTYLTIYSGNKLPPFYIGYSTVEKVNNGYRGSVRSKAYKATWKGELKDNPQLFRTVIISTHPTRDEASDKETALQKHLNVHKNPLYINRHIAATNFFNTGYSFSKEHREKISMFQKGKSKPSLKLKESTRRNALRAHEAIRGVPKSDEHRKKIGDANRARVWSDESKLKNSTSHKGKTLSEETRAKMSASRVGKIQSIETRLKNSQKVTDGVNIFNSKGEAAIFHNISEKTVYNRAKKEMDGWRYL